MGSCSRAWSVDSADIPRIPASHIPVILRSGCGTLQNLRSDADKNSMTDFLRIAVRNPNVLRPSTVFCFCANAVSLTIFAVTGEPVAFPI